MIAQIGHGLANPAVEDGDAELGRDFRIDVLQPVDQVSTAVPGGILADQGEQRRIGHRYQNVLALEDMAQVAPGGSVKRKVIDAAAGERRAAKLRGRDATDLNTIEEVMGR